jgi:hypothetical protein
MDVPNEMVALKDQLWPTLFATPGVQGMDIGLRENDGNLGEELCFRVFVEDLSNVPEGLPTDFGGFSVQVLQRAAGEFLIDDTPHRPVEGGVSISSAHRANPSEVPLQSGVGTLGGIVFDSQTRELLGLSCAHVLASGGGAQAGDDCFQPQITNQFPNTAVNRIGALKRFTFGQTQPLFPGGSPINFTDAAVCTIERQAIMSIAEIGSVTGTNSARPEDHVRKRGRTTGLTHGIVTGVMGAYFNQQMSEWFVDLITIKTDTSLSFEFCTRGDSGSFVVNEQNEVVGLLFLGFAQGVGMACDIGTTCAEIGVSFA